MKFFITLLILLFSHFTFGQEIKEQTDVKVWSLEDCITYAVQHNITVKDASLNTDIAKVNYTTAKSAKLPNLFGSVSQTFSNGSSINPITSDYVSDQIYSNSFGVNSSVVLFQGFQLNNQIKQNSLLVQQNGYLEEIAKNDIIVSILQNYLQTLYSKESIAIAENNLKNSEKEVLRAKARLNAGSIAMNDYTEAQSQAATNKYNVIAAKNNYQQYFIALKQLLELPPSENMEVESIDENMDLVNLNLSSVDIYQKAIDFLPETGSSLLNIAAKETQLDIAKGGYLPTLSLTGSLGSGYTSINNNSFANQLNVNFNQRIGLTLSIPIFDRNQTKAAVQTANINIEKAQIQKQSTEKEIYKKVETAYQNSLSAQEQVIAAKASKTAAEQSYKLAQKKYELGALSTTDLVISQNTYTNAQQNYLQSKYLNILYQQLLQFYQGNGFKL